MGWAEKSEMSDFGNKNVLFLYPFVPKIALKSRVDFSQPKFIGRLKSTLLAVPSAALYPGLDFVVK